MSDNKLVKYGIKEIPVVCEVCTGHIVDEPTKFLLHDCKMIIVHTICYLDNTPEQFINKLSEAKEKLGQMKEQFQELEQVKFDGADNGSN